MAMPLRINNHGMNNNFLYCRETFAGIDFEFDKFPQTCPSVNHNPIDHRAMISREHTPSGDQTLHCVWHSHCQSH